jgi:hypothetical protein
MGDDLLMENKRLEMCFKDRVHKECYVGWTLRPSLLHW